jgi:hypothetical protein
MSSMMASVVASGGGGLLFPKVEAFRAFFGWRVL